MARRQPGSGAARGRCDVRWVTRVGAGGGRCLGRWLSGDGGGGTLTTVEEAGCGRGGGREVGVRLWRGGGEVWEVAQWRGSGEVAAMVVEQGSEDAGDGGGAGEEGPQRRGRKRGAAGEETLRR
uniref:Uncharacterized protein n=1 Tax=Triticum urartu TaxID=4572 RepID=A0A8R7UEF6_TRIUA